MHYYFNFLHVYVQRSCTCLLLLLTKLYRFYRVPLYLGMFAVGLNLLIFFYTSMMAWRIKRFDEKWELAGIAALPYVTLVGLAAFCM